MKRLIALAILMGAAFVAPAGAATYDPDDPVTSVWTRADALKIQRDATNTKPRIPGDFPVTSNQVWVWDTWPLTALDTALVSYRGWHVIFSLVAPRTVPFPERHVIATIGYFYSRDGQTWKYGGRIFSRGTALGSHQWAGSAALVGDEVNLFYTATGADEPVVNDPDDVRQRLAHATARIRADENGVWFAGRQFRDSRVIAEADGRLYQTEAQSQGSPIIYAFRDPFVFRDPASPAQAARTCAAGSSCRHCCRPTASTSRPSARTWSSRTARTTCSPSATRGRSPRASPARTASTGSWGRPCAATTSR
jgi:levansucrase